MSRILVVDDDPGMLAAIEGLLAPEGHEMLLTAEPTTVLGLLSSSSPDLAILDVCMPGMNGLELCRRIKERHPFLPVIVMTGKGTTEVAIEASQFGATHYLLKPFDPAEMIRVVQRALESARQGTSMIGPAREDELENGSIIGQSPAMQEVYRAIGRVARMDTTVLIRGESGTGKELVAKAVWRHSARADRPLLTLNCAAIPETLMESELFGHEKGAFTGAGARRIGKFEQAHRGTILLDEIADVSLAVQAKILRVLQERTFERVGGNETLRVDVRIIAATNRNLETALRHRRLREDLYHRLRVLTIHVPPLRERREDIVPLIRHFFTRFTREFQVEAPVVSKDALQLMCDYRWPGNVRELENCIHRIFVLNPGTCIQAEDVRHVLDQKESALPVARSVRDQEKLLMEAVRLHLSSHAGGPIHELLIDKVSRLAVLEALRREEGNQTRAAEVLGMPRPTLHAKMRKYGIQVGFRLDEPTRPTPDQPSGS